MDYERVRKSLPNGEKEQWLKRADYFALREIFGIERYENYRRPGIKEEAFARGGGL